MKKKRITFMGIFLFTLLLLAGCGREKAKEEKGRMEKLPALSEKEMQETSFGSQWGSGELDIHKRGIAFRDFSTELQWKAISTDDAEWIPQVESENFTYGEAEEEYFFTLGGVFEKYEEVWAVLYKRDRRRGEASWAYPVRYDLGNGAVTDFLAGIFIEGKELFDCTELKVWKEGEQTFAKVDGIDYFLDLEKKEALPLLDILGENACEQFFWLGDGNYVYTVDKGKNLYDGYLFHWETREKQQLFSNQELTILEMGQSGEPAILLENGYLLIGRNNEVFLQYYLTGSEWKIDGLTFEDTLGLWNYDRNYIYFDISKGEEGELGFLSLKDKTYQKCPFEEDWNELVRLWDYGFYILEKGDGKSWSIFNYDFLESEQESREKSKIAVNLLDWEESSWALETVEEYIENMGKDWNQFLNSFTKEKSRELKALFPELLRKKRGVCNVKSAKLLEVTEVSYDEEVQENFPFQLDDYPTIKIVTVKVEYETYEDTDFYSNGTSEDWLALTRENGIWKVIGPGLREKLPEQAGEIRKFTPEIADEFYIMEYDIHFSNWSEGYFIASMLVNMPARSFSCIFPRRMEENGLSSMEVQDLYQTLDLKEENIGERCLWKDYDSGIESLLFYGADSKEGVLMITKYGDIYVKGYRYLGDKKAFAEKLRVFMQRLRKEWLSEEDRAFLVETVKAIEWE